MAEVGEGEGIMSSMRFRVGLAIFLLSQTVALASPIPVVSATQNSDGVTLHMNPGVMKLQVWSDRIIRVEYSPAESFPTASSFAVIGTPGEVKWNYSETPVEEKLTTPLIEARVNRTTGAVGFYNSAGKMIFGEGADGGKDCSTLPR
ncbi:MAG TPA: DUF4968 domain-containing protein, partial [Tepidisphaeraceae bacterium]|nr:DUF4968 domain-containing protein [Tepidisphaeraceae bacterium]